MKKPLALLLVCSITAPALVLAAGPFEEKDFQWDPFKSLYKRVVIAGVNNIARDNPKCTTIDPASVEHAGGTPDDPEFVVTCGEPGQISHVHFSKTDVTGDPASNVPLGEK